MWNQRFQGVKTFGVIKKRFWEEINNGVSRVAYLSLLFLTPFIIVSTRRMMVKVEKCQGG